MPWLPVRLDPFLDVAGEIIVDDRVRPARLQVGDHFGDHPPHWLRRFDECHGAVILFDHDLDALPNLGQHGGDVLHHFRFGHMYGSHAFDCTGSPAWSSSLGNAKIRLESIVDCLHLGGVKPRVKPSPSGDGFS